MRKPLKLPAIDQLDIKLERRGQEHTSNMAEAANYLTEIIRMNADERNFRVFSPTSLNPIAWVACLTPPIANMRGPFRRSRNTPVVMAASWKC
jgi:hypothetical protein